MGEDPKLNNLEDGNMNEAAKKALGALVVEKALHFGASLAGIARVEDLKESPSHLIIKKLPYYSGVGTIKIDGRKENEVEWPREARSAIVLAVEHPEEKPEMDWWGEGIKGGTAGNSILMDIVSKLTVWLGEEKGVKCFELPYYIETGGIFMKDAAVMAGLGWIGKNNMLITRKYGPRVRLRAMLTGEEFLPTGPADFNPCFDCDLYCRKACPQKAFEEKIYPEEKYESSDLPGRSGVYSRVSCNDQMNIDHANIEEVKLEGREKPGQVVKFCRLCEFSCPVGKEQQ